MSFHNELVVPPYFVQLDTENIVSLLALVALLTFFHSAFEKLIQPGGGKESESRWSYGNSAAV